MKEVGSFETGKGRGKKTHVVVSGGEIQPRKDLSKENQGRRLAPKPPIYGDKKIKIGSDQQRWPVSTKYGIVEGSYVPEVVVKSDFVVYKESEDQMIDGLKNEAKEAKQ
jgi:hypothetical protein